ncbi:PSME3-interacting protein-like isoform X2 [Porites lutea]|uniref:PSME3-interacting protein-like isoform X2 n=1 Tax=Porites lutea TaxID=51062 RepID=UPI003CC60CA2
MSGVSFVSEAELDEIRDKRQKEWEKVRKEDDPLECPEQVHDNKTLYERLQEQKQKKQDEWDEQHQLKNMIRGLDSDETLFLDLVSKQQEEIASRRFNEETQEIREYRDAVSQFQSTAAVPADIKLPGSAVLNRKSSQESGTKKSQLQLIAGAIKRKGNSEKTSPQKRTKVCEEVKETVGKNQENENVSATQRHTSLVENKTMDQLPGNETKTESEQNQAGEQRPVIPGLGIYSDSSDSETSDE